MSIVARLVPFAISFVVSACGSAPPPTDASLPPEESAPAAPAARGASSRASAGGAGALVVNNVCSASADSYFLQARIDADSIGGEPPASRRVVWTLSCKNDECRGSKVELDPWLEGRALEPSSLGALERLEFVEGSPSAFVVRSGTRMFRVDVSRSEVGFEDSGPSRQRGTAPCSSAGVPWPGK